MKKNLKLSDIPKHNVHRVPEGYFEQLPMRVMERTAAREQLAGEAWYVPYWRPIRFAVAPLLLLLLFAGIYLTGLHQPLQPENVSLASLSDEEIVNYLNTYAQVDAIDLEEQLTLDQDLPADFLNVSASAAEEELEYYPLDDIDY